MAFLDLCYNTDVKKRCVIIAAGAESNLDFITHDDFVIACDKGFEYAQKQNIPVDCVLGDFDSTTKPTNHPRVQVFPEEKDDTDTMLAIKYAIALGYRQLFLTCGLGNRLDHSFANIQAGLYATQQGVELVIIESQTEIHFICNGQKLFSKKENTALSVFSLTAKAFGVNMAGTKYEAQNLTLSFDFPLGISNQWALDVANISVSEGVLMVVMDKLR